MTTITRLPSTATPAQLDGLAEVLADCVAGGASVNFVAPFGVAAARDWWQARFADPGHARNSVFAGIDDLGVAGCDILARDLPPNQAHRGDIAKLLVHRRARGRGLADALMAAAEAEAVAAGLTLLCLDTATGEPAEGFYARRGWIRVGVIPDFAKFPDGRPCATTFFYKRIG